MIARYYFLLHLYYSKTTYFAKAKEHPLSFHFFTTLIVTKPIIVVTNRKPTLLLTTTDKSIQLIRSYFQLWGLYILFFVGFAIVKKYAPELFEQEYEQSFLKGLLKDNPLKLFILAVIFAPIIEEMMFRTLIKPSHSDLILLLCSWPIFYVNRFIPVDVHWAIKLAFIAVLLFTIFYVLRELIPIQKTKKIRAFLNKYYVGILIISSLLFGLVHINNYVENFAINAALIALIIPRIISGVMMGLIKIKNQHIIWSMGLHALNNGVVISLLIIASKI